MRYRKIANKRRSSRDGDDAGAKDTHDAHIGDPQQDMRTVRRELHNLNPVDILSGDSGRTNAHRKERNEVWEPAVFF